MRDFFDALNRNLAERGNGMEYKDFEKKIKSARNAFIKSDTKMREIISEIKSEFPGIELTELETTAENASNAEEAIYCYLQYGESTPQGIWDDILLGYAFGNNK